MAGPRFTLTQIAVLEQPPPTAAATGWWTETWLPRLPRSAGVDDLVVYGGDNIG